MPAVPELLNALAQMGSVAPRAYGSDSLLARQPAIDIAAMGQNAPHAAPIAKRQQMIIQQGIIPTYYDLSGPEPGTVVGIVLGSVAVSCSSSGCSTLSSMATRLEQLQQWRARRRL